MLLKRYLRYHPSTTFNNPDTPLKRFKRLLQPGKAKRAAWAAAYIGEAEQFPDLMHPCQSAGAGPAARGHLAVDACTAGWSNQAPLYPRQWFLQEIIPYAEAHPPPVRGGRLRRAHLQRQAGFRKRAQPPR